MLLVGVKDSTGYGGSPCHTRKFLALDFVFGWCALFIFGCMRIWLVCADSQLWIASESRPPHAKAGDFCGHERPGQEGLGQERVCGHERPTAQTSTTMTTPHVHVRVVDPASAHRI